MQNKRVQGTLHKVSGPLTRDVRNMKTNILILLLASLFFSGCMTTQRYARFDAADLSTREYFGIMRLVRAKPTTGTPNIGGYAHWNSPTLGEANGFLVSIIDQQNRSRRPTLSNVTAEFGPVSQPPAILRILGSNDDQGMLLLLKESVPLNQKDLYRLRLEFTDTGTRYVFTCVGQIKETVERELLPPFPNAGFSRAMK